MTRKETIDDVMRIIDKYKVVEVDGAIRSAINKKGKPSKYEDPKLFETAEAAGRWIDRHSYEGMSHHYEIVRVK